jgi:GT2 family glycosyltransferase
MDVSIIIVNFNTRDLTAQCIESVYENTKDIHFEIILVDNASSDDSRDYFARDTRIVFIQSEENLGFGRGNNLGMRYAKGKYFFLLNSDTIVLNNIIKDLFDFAESNPQLKIGALGTLLLDKQHRVVRSFGRFLSGSFFLYQDKLYQRILIQRNTELKFFEVECVLGAALFVSREVVSNVGTFDPKFFMYYEENDWEKRMSKAGYSNYILNKSGIIHLDGASFSNKLSKYKYSLVQESRWIYAKKHLKGFSYLFFYIVMKGFRIIDFFRGR